MPGELISREALDRILQRAAELQAGEHDVGEGLTEAELLALGTDVGIPARYLRQALLEERTRTVAAVPKGLWAWLAGPAQLAAARVVPGDRGGPAPPRLPAAVGPAAAADPRGRGRDAAAPAPARKREGPGRARAGA